MNSLASQHNSYESIAQPQNLLDTCNIVLNLKDASLLIPKVWPSIKETEFPDFEFEKTTLVELEAHDILNGTFNISEDNLERFQENVKLLPTEIRIEVAMKLSALEASDEQDDFPLEPVLEEKPASSVLLSAASEELLKSNADQSDLQIINHELNIDDESEGNFMENLNGAQLKRCRLSTRAQIELFENDVDEMSSDQNKNSEFVHMNTAEKQFHSLPSGAQMALINHQNFVNDVNMSDIPAMEESPNNVQIISDLEKSASEIADLDDSQNFAAEAEIENPPQAEFFEPSDVFDDAEGSADIGCEGVLEEIPEMKYELKGDPSLIFAQSQHSENADESIPLGDDDMYEPMIIRETEASLRISINEPNFEEMNEQQRLEHVLKMTQPSSPDLKEEEEIDFAKMSEEDRLQYVLKLSEESSNIDWLDESQKKMIHRVATEISLAASIVNDKKIIPVREKQNVDIALTDSVLKTMTEEEQMNYVLAMSGGNDVNNNNNNDTKQLNRFPLIEKIKPKRVSHLDLIDEEQRAILESLPEDEKIEMIMQLTSQIIPEDLPVITEEPKQAASPAPDFSKMSEEEQITYLMESSKMEDNTSDLDLERRQISKMTSHEQMAYVLNLSNEESGPIKIKDIEIIITLQFPNAIHQKSVLYEKDTIWSLWEYIFNAHSESLQGQMFHLSHNSNEFNMGNMNITYEQANVVDGDIISVELDG